MNRKRLPTFWCWFSGGIPAPLLVAGMLGCSPDSDSHLEHGGGTLVPWNAVLAWVDEEPPTLVATVIGLSDVEILEVRDGAVRFERVAPPALELLPDECAARAPFSLGLVNLDGTGPSQLFVQDPCGSWFATPTRSGYGVIDTDLATAIPIGMYLETIRDGSIVVIAHPPFNVELTWMASGRSSLVLLPGSPLGHWVQRMVVPSGEALVVQRRESLAVLPLGEDGDVERSAIQLLEQDVTAPYVAPFTAFDLLTDVSLAGCRASLLGVGVFGADAGAIPRRLQHIVLGTAELGTGQYVAHDLDVASDVVGLVVIMPRTPIGVDQIIGVLQRGVEEHTFTLLGRAGCDDFKTLSERTVDFAIRTPPSPGWGVVGNVPLRDQVSLLATHRVDLGVLEIYHYDGYDLRVFRASTDDWELEQQILFVHETRSDLSLVE